LRVDGFLPIAAYAALGDGQTVGLLAPDGRIDWLPLPTVDGPPGFAALLDPSSGGFIALAPDAPFTVGRRYLPGTNVVETTYRTDTGEVRVVDALAVGRSGRLPWSELIRRVNGVRGSVSMRWCVRPGSRFGTVRPWTEQRRDAVVVHVGDQHMVVRSFAAGPVVAGTRDVGSEFATSEGSTHFLSVASADRAPVPVVDRDHVEGALALTIDRWREWSSTMRYEGLWSDAVRRSALALKLMIRAATGAIAAAPTTSLPERIGGDKNWDYRFMWVRDSSFAADALIALGLREEAQAAVEWLLGAIRRTAPDLHVFYALDGCTAGSVADVIAEGYRNSRPVRSGNGAAGQSQLGSFGDLFDTVWRYVDAGHVLDPGTGHMLAELADRCCDLWMTEDSGIWELGRLRHYTISKIGCWVALDRAVRLADAGEIATGHAGRWAAEAAEIKAWVDEHCWSEGKQSYTFYAGTDDLDAATLLAGRTGFERGERLAGTVQAVRRELGRGALLYRYSGMAAEEGCFLACTFWLVSALTELDDLSEARDLMDRAVSQTNDVGLLAEQMDPGSGAMLGNFPQALSHLALINAATALDRALGG
jgi:GH15 family glucan-1,4-alpha-glucosidase